MNLPNNQPNFNALHKGNKEYKQAFIDAQRYYYTTFNLDDMKKHTEKWLNRTFNSIPASEFKSIGFIAWIINNCCYVHPKVLEHTSKKVNMFYRNSRNLLTIMEEDTPQEKYKKSTKNIISELEAFYDNALHNRTVEKSLEEIVKSYISFDSGNVMNHFVKIENSIDGKYLNPDIRHRAHGIMSEIISKLLFSNQKVLDNQ